MDGSLDAHQEKASHAWGWARDLQFPGVVSPWPKIAGLWKNIPRTKKRAYKPEEMDAALAEARRYGDGRYVPLFCLLAENGGRIGELLRLKGKHVNRSTGHVTFEETKTDEPRTVAVSPEVLALVPQVGRDEWVFPSVRNKSKPFNERTARGALSTILDRAGLKGEPLDYHSFRRYVVRNLHSAGVPLNDAMAFVGHKSVAVHLGYMRGAKQPDQHQNVLEKSQAGARSSAPRDPVRVPARV